MDNNVPSKILSGYKQMALFLGVSIKTIQRHRKSIPILRLGKNNLILHTDLVSWIQEKPKWKHLKKRVYTWRAKPRKGS